MNVVEWVLFIGGFYPLWLTWRAVQGTSLVQAIHWGLAAWIAWGFTLTSLFERHPNPAVFLALTMTGAAGVAVLGARRPIVGAWNFVVLGLVAVMLLPQLEGAFIGNPTMGGLRIGFLIGTLAVGWVNYVPTRFGPAASVMALGCAGELIGVLAPAPLPLGGETHLIRLCWLTAPWLGLVQFPTSRPPSEITKTWRDFRNRWGLVWGQRTREQFNRAAANAGWPVTLKWFGFQGEENLNYHTRAAVGDALTALLQRFLGPDERNK